MLIIFRTKVGDMTMFGDIGKAMLGYMGTSGVAPGALLAADIPPAVERLRAAIAALPDPAGQKVRDADDDDREPKVAMATRAKPLIDLLERAAKARVDVTWEASGK
jgi:Domain of unknown function (DUF1840)